MKRPTIGQILWMGLVDEEPKEYCVLEVDPDAGIVKLEAVEPDEHGAHLQLRIRLSNLAMPN